MNIVVDTNVLISALIRNSTTRKIIIESDCKFYYPETSLHEIRNYKALILDKSGISEVEYDELFNRLLKYVTLITDEQIRPKLKDAEMEFARVDPDDVVFLAAALTIDNCMIWSEDKDFEKQNRIKILKTRDVLKLL
ncbi:MAG: PIN domain-containing protein [Candidatus Aenigmarchaeota archaeon]|nr:PIN domain-containing protein [Candidatus Aenigmarchaeota archaeon]